MRFILTDRERALLHNAGIEFNESREYSETEALALLDQVRDREVAYSQFYGGIEEQLYFEYGRLADKIHNAIPDVGA